MHEAAQTEFVRIEGLIAFKLEACWLECAAELEMWGMADFLKQSSL